MVSSVVELNDISISTCYTSLVIYVVYYVAQGAKECWDWCVCVCVKSTLLMSQLPFLLNCLLVTLHPELCSVELSPSPCVPSSLCSGMLSDFHIFAVAPFAARIGWVICFKRTSKKNVKNHERRDLILWGWKFNCLLY